MSFSLRGLNHTARGTFLGGKVSRRFPQFLVAEDVCDVPILGRPPCARAVANCDAARIKVVVIRFMIAAAQSIGTALGDGN
jgi:hypothetical protein